MILLMEYVGIIKMLGYLDLYLIVKYILTKYNKILDSK